MLGEPLFERGGAVGVVVSQGYRLRSVATPFEPAPLNQETQHASHRRPRQGLAETRVDGAYLTGCDPWCGAGSLPTERFLMVWDAHTTGTGFIRDRPVADAANKQVAFWDCSSQVTAFAHTGIEALVA